MKNKLTTAIFFNHCFDKRRFQNFLYWFFKKSYFGQLRSQPPKRKLLKFLERLKFLGFHSATQAGFSMSIDDLKIPSSKSEILLTAENIVLEADLQLISGNLTIIERYQRIIEIWNRTSEELKYQVLQSFKISDFLNPVYLMAFSGARGNISQIRQLVGMRGLMADPQGQIIDFPIRSNFREGLTLTEYLISCSGARKGIVDTALRTAASGYLTRRLVDVAHHVIVHQMDCQYGLQKEEPVGIWIEDLYDQQKKILPLRQRLIGRVLAETIISSSETTNFGQASALFPKGNALIIGQKNHEISKMTSQKICQYRKRVFVRSPLTCQSSKFICQLCYGWNLSEGQFVSVGEAVGVLAAQSIGEPGTQLTMRTFHTGGVFTGILMDQTYAPFSGIAHYHFPCNGLLIRTLQGKIAYLSKNNGILSISQGQKTSPSHRFQNQRALAFGFILKNRPVLPLLKKVGTKSLDQTGWSQYKLQQKRKNLARQSPIALHRESSPLSKRLVEELSAYSSPKKSARARTSNYQTLLYQLRKLKGQFKEMIFLNPPRRAPGEQVKVRKKEMSVRGGGVRKADQWALAQKQIQFIFQNFTILYVRQNEKVLKKQLIAELPFFENEKSLENEQEILSNESGEIYFWDIVFLEKTISDFKNEIQFKKNFVQDLGGFWILFGRSFQHILIGNSPFFKKFDLIDQNVPFSQIQIESNYFLNNEIDDFFYQNRFLQFEQIFLSKKTNHKDRIFKQQLGLGQAKNDLNSNSCQSNLDEYTLNLKRSASRTVQMGLIFFKKWGYLRMTRLKSKGNFKAWSSALGFTEGIAQWSWRTENNHKQQKPQFGPSASGLPFAQFNFIQIFNGIEPIWTYFWNKKKVFWKDRPNFQSQKLETWMIGLQGQSKYITGASSFRNPFIKISIKPLHIHFLKQKEFCFKFFGSAARTPYIQNSYRYHGDPIFWAKPQFQKQKRNFFLSDTGRVLEKSKRIFCEFQNPHFFKKYKPYFVHLNDDHVQNQRSVSEGEASTWGPPKTFLTQSENFFLNVNPEDTRACILLVNRQGIFQSFERKVLKNRMGSFVTSQIRKVVRQSGRWPKVRVWQEKLLAFFPSRWIAKVQDFQQIQDEASFQIGTQIFYQNQTKPIYKLTPIGGTKWPFGKSFRLKIRQWLAQTGSPFWLGLKDSFFQPQLLKKKNNNLEPQLERVYYWSLCTPLLQKTPFGYLDPKFNFSNDALKIQSIFCHLFLKHSRLFQNLPKNWARQITNIQPKIIHWKNLPNQKYIFLLNFITHFDSAKYIKQKNLKKIDGPNQKTVGSEAVEDPRDLGLSAVLSKEKDGQPSAHRPLGGQFHPEFILEDFLEKIQRPKKQTFQQNLICNNLQWLLGSPERTPVEAFWKQKSKNLLNIGFVPKLGFSQMTVPAVGERSPKTTGPPSFLIKPYNFWKIQQRQEILRYQKLKIGFYSFIRIFFSLERFSFEDLKWMNVLYHHWKAVGGEAADPKGQLGLVPGNKPRLQFNRTQHFFKTFKIRRIRQKSNSICSEFHQRMPQIFSINEQKPIFINWALASKKSGFSLFFIQELLAPKGLSFIQKHTKIFSLIPYKTVLNIQKNRLFGSAQDVSFPQDPEEDNRMSASAPPVLAPGPQSGPSLGAGPESFCLTGQHFLKFNKKRMCPPPATKIPYPLTNLFNDHQQIFYGKFKKNFQNIHLNSMSWSAELTREMGIPFEDPCSRWKFFGDCTIILEKNIYSTYLKAQAPIEVHNFNKAAAIKGLSARCRPPANRRQKLKPLELSKKKAKLGWVRDLDPRVQNFNQELDLSHTELGPVGALPVQKYLFDQILPRSLVRSESGIFKLGLSRHQLGFSQLQKWILDNYFDSYLLIIKNFSLLKNFENRFFSSLPKKPIYNQFYYHDNKVETDWALAEYINQFGLSQKSNLQEDIIRQYFISSLRHLSKVQFISSWFSKAQAQFLEKFHNSDFFKNSNTMANKGAPDPTGFDFGPSQPLIVSKNEFNVASPAEEPNLQDLFELPIHLYNFYIEYISKKSSRLKSGFSALDFEKIDMKTWLNRLKNLQKYSCRYSKSPILLDSQDEVWTRSAGEWGLWPVQISSLRYKKYWRKTIFFHQKLENDRNKKKQYCFVFKWLKPLDHFYSIHLNQNFFYRQTRKSFRIPFFGSGEVWTFAGDFFQTGEPRRVDLPKPKIVQKPLFFQTPLYFKTYPIFTTLLSIYFNNPRWSLQALRRRDLTTERTVVPNTVPSYKSKTSWLKPRFHSFFNFLSLQTEYLNNFLLQNRLKYFIPLFDKKLEIFLVSVVPIRAQARSLRPQQFYSSTARPYFRHWRPLATPFGWVNFIDLYNQTHSLKIQIIKTKHLNFLTQKYLRVETVKASEHFGQNRDFHLTSLLNLSKAKAAQQFQSLPFGQNGRNQPKRELPFQIIKRFSKRSGIPSTPAKPNLLHSSEIQIFIRFFLPFDSGEMLSLHKQGSLSILFSNVSDFFSYRQNPSIDFVCPDVRNDDSPVRLGQKFKYLFFGKIQKGNEGEAKFFLLKNPSTIFYRLQRQNKKNGSFLVSALRTQRGYLGRPVRASASQPKSNLDGLTGASWRPAKLASGSKAGGWVDGGLITPQQFCFSQKIFYSYKLFPNFNSKIPATTLFTKKTKTAGSFNLFKKSQKTPVLIGHHPNALESPIQLGSFIRGLATNGRELAENAFHLQGGQFIAKTPHIFLFRKATTHLLNDQSILHVRHGDIILKNQPLCSVFYNQSKTGDIVQGIPKIEEIFEARKKSKYSLHELPIFSKDFLFFEKIIIKYLRSLQKSVVNNIQRIYCGQGIHISDKHIEIIVRQMTSNVLIREPGQTGLLYGEIVALQWISRINVISNQVIYEPVLMGMTKTCLETSSFLSAASFQETTRILGRAALQNQIDFIRGLKQNVILGNLIPIGTGCF